MSQSLVSKRVKFNKLPCEVKDLIRQDILTEAHLDEITGIFVNEYFHPWLTSDQITLELAQKIKYDAEKKRTKTYLKT